MERAVNVDVPVVLCIDDKPSVGGQPSGAAYAKAAANGFRSVLTLRSKPDGVDLVRERLMVERKKMRKDYLIRYRKSNLKQVLRSDSAQMKISVISGS
jgi:hypothetical protein